MFPAPKWTAFLVILGASIAGDWESCCKIWWIRAEEFELELDCWDGMMGRGSPLTAVK